MSTNSWQTSLRAVFQTPRNETQKRVAILGMGHELRGDDAAGLAVIRALQDKLPTVDDLLLLDTGPSPEAYTGRLREFRPDWILFIDAAQVDAEPGTVVWLSHEEITGLSASTHTLPISVMTKYLITEFKCKIALICIQPEQTRFDTPVSTQIQNSVQTLVDAFVQAISP